MHAEISNCNAGGSSTSILTGGYHRTKTVGDAEMFGGASASAAGQRAFVVTVFEQVESRWCR